MTTRAVPPAGRARWLLIGSTGRVGRMLAAHWQEVPPPEGLCRQYRNRDGAGDGAGDRGSREAGGTLRWAPLEDGEALRRASDNGNGFSCLFMLAGTTPAPGADLELNAVLARAVLAAAERGGVARVLLASSSAVYGARPGPPFTEQDLPAPVNAYGHAKLAMEDACHPFRDRGLEVCCLRIGNVAGADALLLNAARAQAKAPLRLDRFADGRGPLRSYIGPVTLARVLGSLARHAGALPETLNIAAPGATAMADLAEVAGVPWRWVPAPEMAHQSILLDCTRLAALHPFDPDDAAPARMLAEARATGGAG